ncbi:hypothetical protein LVR36_02455, partial [Klebsiella variicola subsp. variicola]|uniref:hypothetical protein n=1 Tax=Klebsiella variicola TaxID=244366 RepID=UPI001E40AB60
SVHHIWCPLSSQEYQDLPDGAETTLTDNRDPDEEPNYCRNDHGSDAVLAHFNLSHYVASGTRNTSALNVRRWMAVGCYHRVFSA